MAAAGGLGLEEEGWNMEMAEESADLMPPCQNGDFDVWLELGLCGDMTTDTMCRYCKRD